MKFFHLSDLHIGLKLMNRDLREDQEYILNEITELAKQEYPDAVVIAGDIYDKAVPSAEAVEMFDQFLEKLTEAVPDAVIMMISGNHDSAPRVWKCELLSAPVCASIRGKTGGWNRRKWK